MGCDITSLKELQGASQSRILRLGSPKHTSSLDVGQELVGDRRNAHPKCAHRGRVAEEAPPTHFPRRSPL